MLEIQCNCTTSQEQHYHTQTPCMPELTATSTNTDRQWRYNFWPIHFKVPRLFSIIDRSEWHFFLLAWLGNISIKLKWLCFAHDHCRLGNNTLKRADYRYGKAQEPSLPPPPCISKHFCTLFVTWHGSTFYLAAQSICDMGQGLSIVQSKWILPPHVDMLKSQLFSSLGSNCVKWLQNACQIRIGEMAPNGLNVEEI